MTVALSLYQTAAARHPGDIVYKENHVFLLFLDFGFCICEGNPLLCGTVFHQLVDNALRRLHSQHADKEPDVTVCFLSQHKQQVPLQKSGTSNRVVPLGSPPES